MTIRAHFSGAPAHYFTENGQWHQFRLTLEAAGLDLVPVSKVPCGNKDWFLAFQHDAGILSDVEVIPKSQRILLVWEPKIVDPRYYRASCLSSYGHRFAISPEWATAIQGEAAHWPQAAFDDLDFAVDSWPLRANRVVLINANKTSVLANERFTLRRLVIESCDRQEIPLDVFGTGWHSPILQRYTHWAHATAVAMRERDATTIGSIRVLSIKPKNWGGVIPDKKTVFQQARVALAIENAGDYVSEKLFDAVGAGCLTIYCGPDRLSDFGIEMDDRLVCSPTASALVGRLNWALNLPATTQLALAKQQFEDLRPIASEWETSRVLGELGESIVTKINESISPT